MSFRYTHQDEKNNFELLTYYIDSFRTSDLETDVSATTSRMDTSPRDYKVFAIEPRWSRACQLGNSNSEFTIGYRYLDEDSSEFAGRTEYAINALPRKFLARTSSNGGTEAHAFYIDNRFDLGSWVITPGIRFESIDTYNNFSAYKSGNLLNTVNPTIQSNEWLPNLSILSLYTTKIDNSLK